MSYYGYKGDFGYYTPPLGDPGFFSFLGKAAKFAFKHVLPFVPVVGQAVGAVQEVAQAFKRPKLPPPEAPVVEYEEPEYEEPEQYEEDFSDEEG